MPQVMQNVQMPFVKWKTQASTPIRYAANTSGSIIFACMNA